MKEGPDIARVAALIGDPARANILTALMSGKALTVTELSHEAGVTISTVSTHLARLTEGGLIVPRPSGRHKYFTLASPAVARVIEAMMGLSAGAGHMRTRTGPGDTALRQARICYNHLAGESGIRLHESLLARGFLTAAPDGLALTAQGTGFIAAFGVDIATLRHPRRPLCRECLDWSERRPHLGGPLGRALFDRMEAAGWLSRTANSRAVAFTSTGRKAFDSAFPVTSGT